jgi:hypothetical protein
LSGEVLPKKSTRSSKRVRTQSSGVPNPENDQPPSNLTALPSAEWNGKVPTGPANPGVIQNRDTALLRLPPDSDVLETFANLRKDNSISDEEAFLKLISVYDVPLSAVHKIATAKLPVSFSNVNYRDIAPYMWLDPGANGSDIHQLKVFRSRMPLGMFRELYKDVHKATIQYGRMAFHDNEEARSRFIASFFGEIVSVFRSSIVNRPEGLLESEVTKKGRIEYHFNALRSVSIVFIEVKKVYTVGKDRLDVVAQVLAECAACDYANSRDQHWVPILGVLCDGEKFDFFVYDSGTKAVYSSGNVTGVFDVEGKSKLFVSSLKETTEYLFDFFMMAYINGLRSFGHRSELKAAQTKTKKRKSTDKWMEALAKAEHAHLLCREAAILASQGMFEMAEKNAASGLDELETSVALVPEVTQEGGILEMWDEEVAMKA